MCTPRLPFTSSRQTYGPSESRTPPRAEYCRAQLPVGVWGGANGLTNCASWRRLWQVLGQENIAAPQVLESGLDMADHAGVHGGASEQATPQVSAVESAKRATALITFLDHYSRDAVKCKV